MSEHDEENEAAEAEDEDGDVDVSTDASGKSYLLIQQTNYDQTDDETYPGTYVQLGSYPTWGDAAQRGDDLLSGIGITSATTAFFKDDHRAANGHNASDTTYTRNDGNSETTTTAAALTSELLTRGGIRLHTDGNYVSTTRGDRVDVIFGNYHLHVHGRTNSTTFWESSGGHTVSADSALRERVTAIEYDSEHGAYTAYKETLKGDHIERYQGLIEEVFECEEINETLGPDITADDETASIPATTSNAHEQDDARDHWVNPSSGYGTGWPRKQEKPDVKETFAAKKFDESLKVSSSLGAASTDGAEAGSYSAERQITSSSKETIDATTVEDLLYGYAGAEVVEAIGEAPQMSHGHVADWTTGTWAGTHDEGQICAGSVRTAIFETMHDTRHGSWNLKVEVLPINVNVNVGIKLSYTDMTQVELIPAIFRPSYYERSKWVSGSSAGDVALDALFGALRVTGLGTFGRSETVFSVKTPSVGFCLGARASIHVCPMATHILVDHIEANFGAHVEMGLFKAIAALCRGDLEAFRHQSGAAHGSAAALHVQS